jgi:hypothetical protein
VQQHHPATQDSVLESGALSTTATNA